MSTEYGETFEEWQAAKAQDEIDSRKDFDRHWDNTHCASCGVLLSADEIEVA